MSIVYSICMLKIIFLTFASKPTELTKYPEIEFAAKRLISQASETGEFFSSISVGWDEVEKFTNANHIKLPANPNLYLFKPLLASMAISGYFGHADIYFYADAGCEITNNNFAKADFKKMVSNARKQGIYAEGTRYKDISWCKYELIELLSPPDGHLNSGQVQAGFFLISNSPKTANRVVGLIDEWVEIALTNEGFYIGDLYDANKQSDLFISPRYDQSIFSLLLKKYSFRIFREKRRGFGILPTLRGSNTFLHTSRNRTGRSQLPKYINNKNIGFISRLASPLLACHDFLSDRFGIRKQYKEYNPRTIAVKSGW
jgi:hypothetical protein